MSPNITDHVAPEVVDSGAGLPGEKRDAAAQGEGIRS